MTKNYLLKILEQCSDQQFGQDAVEWAIVSGWITLTGQLETDLRAIMGATCNNCKQVVELDNGLRLKPHQPSGKECYNSHTRDYTRQYDEIIEAYRRVREEHGDALVDLYYASGVMGE